MGSARCLTIPYPVDVDYVLQLVRKREQQAFGVKDLGINFVIFVAIEVIMSRHGDPISVSNVFGSVSYIYKGCMMSLNRNWHAPWHRKFSDLIRPVVYLSRPEVDLSRTEVEILQKCQILQKSGHRQFEIFYVTA